MTKLSRLLIGFGFLWMSLWAIVGSLLGARINTIAASTDTQWLESWERTLFRTAHAHMNSMAMTLILMGITAPRAAQFIQKKNLNIIAYLTMCSIPIFGTGLLLEAFYAPEKGQISWVTGVTALGGIGYIVGISVWGSLFIAGKSRI